MTQLHALPFAFPLAHVKWFSNFDWSTTPRSFAEIINGTFWQLFALSIASLVLLVLLDGWAERSAPLRRLGDWFESKKPFSLLVMRVATFAVILVAFHDGTLFAPELRVDQPWIERLQFALLFLLVVPRLTSYAGVVLGSLWVYGALKFGLLHMVDYLNVVGVAYFLAVRPRTSGLLRESVLPVLYATMGFSLLWLGCEKLVFPQWGSFVLDQNPILKLGLPTDFFLTAAAFIEITLGFLLTICLFSRSISITITLVFFTTTAIFGKVEIIGHTLLHAALIVFLLEGAGHRFRPPALFHRSKGMRLAFATVNFSIVLFGVLATYQSLAARSHAPNENVVHTHGQIEVSDPSRAPTLELQVTEDSKSGFNVRLVTERFRFTPEHVGGESPDGEGHAHLYVNGRKVARVYSEWFHLGPLPAGEHSIRATLNANDHREFTREGQVIAGEATVQVAK